MASPIITPMPVQTDTNYRPISRLAVIGLLLSLLSPVIFANENLYWILIAVILPAFVLCMMAWRSIRQSEGNLAGEAIALLGVVVSVASGLGWITMTTVTKYVTESEAKAAVNEWLEKLQNNQPGAAFLLTNPPKTRNLDFNPEEYAKLRKQFPTEVHQVSAFDNFLVGPICGQILRYSDRIKVTYDGLIESQTTRESPGYRFRYLISSPIADGSFVVTTRGEDYLTDDGVRRGWKMSIDGSASYYKLTPYGEQLKALQTRAQEEVDNFIKAVVNGDMKAANEAFDPKSPGELQNVLSWIRKGATGALERVDLLKPMRLRSDKQEGNTWTLLFDCTAIVDGDRAVEFSLTFTTSDPDFKKCILKDCHFLAVRKVQRAGPITMQEGGAAQKPPDAPEPPRPGAAYQGPGAPPPKK